MLYRGYSPMAQNNNKPPTATSHKLFWFWVAMVFITIVFGLIEGPNSNHFWIWWEGGALVTATVYTTVFYIRLFTRDDDTQQRLYKGIGDWVGLVPLLCAGAILSLGTATTATFLTSFGRGVEFTDWLSHWLCMGCDKHILPLI